MFLDRLAFFPSFHERVPEDPDQTLVLCIGRPIVDWARYIAFLRGPDHEHEFLIVYQRTSDAVRGAFREKNSRLYAR